MKWIFFDCDSTLSAIEGVDELARLRPPEVFAEVVDLTNRAMNGEIPIDQVFGSRLEVIRPSRQECEQIGQLYIDRVEPTAQETVAAVRAQGWTPAIISGGYRPVIQPLAKWLGVETIEAVDLFFDDHGSYTGFEETHPNTRNGGKPEIIRHYRDSHALERVVMVGDGMSDLETREVVDLFVGYGGIVERERVQKEADAFVHRLIDVVALL